ncbi:hypothetical protein FRB94_013997 [Tulasnella sp. JGI-2019a]|nr:hypothetical protein FRB94_013997 [Tulasnella sp. JGI-2019a]
MTTSPIKNRPQTRSITKSLANTLANPVIAPAIPAVAPANPVVAPVSPVITPANLIVVPATPDAISVCPVVTPASTITTRAVVTRELTPTEIVYVDGNILRARFNSGPLAVLPKIVEAEASTQTNEGDELGFDDVYRKFNRRAKGASGQVYDIREVGAQLAEPVTLVCKVIDCALDCHGFPMASLGAKAEALDRAMREVHTLEDLDHANIVHLHR